MSAARNSNRSLASDLAKDCAPFPWSPAVAPSAHADEEAPRGTELVVANRQVQPKALVRGTPPLRRAFILDAISAFAGSISHWLAWTNFSLLI